MISALSRLFFPLSSKEPGILGKVNSSVKHPSLSVAQVTSPYTGEHDKRVYLSCIS